MQSRSNLLPHLLLFPLIVAAGCASRIGPAADRSSGIAGKHLVYRDANGEPTMQIDYPTEDFCRRVEAIARRDARCEPDSAEGQLRAKATLRYDPPGMLVQGHYPDLARCRSATARTAAGVRLVNPCVAKQAAQPGQPAR